MASRQHSISTKVSQLLALRIETFTSITTNQVHMVTDLMGTSSKFNPDPESARKKQRNLI